MRTRCSSWTTPTTWADSAETPSRCATACCGPTVPRCSCNSSMTRPPPSPAPTRSSSTTARSPTSTTSRTSTSSTSAKARYGRCMRRIFFPTIRPRSSLATGDRTSTSSCGSSTAAARSPGPPMAGSRNAESTARKAGTAPRCDDRFPRRMAATGAHGPGGAEPRPSVPPCESRLRKHLAADPGQRRGRHPRHAARARLTTSASASCVPWSRAPASDEPLEGRLETGLQPFSSDIRQPPAQSHKGGAMSLIQRVLALALVAGVVSSAAAAATAGPQFSAWEPAEKIDEVAGNNPDLNTSFTDGCPIQSPDGLSLYLASNRPGGKGGLDIWVATRASSDEPWGQPADLPEPINSASDDFCPTPIQGDGLFFVSRRVAEGVTCGLGDIYFARREATGNWSRTRHLACAPAGPNSALDEQGPSY